MLSVDSGLFGTNNVNILCDEQSPEATAEVWHSGGIVVKGVASILELAYEKYQDILQSIQEGQATVTDLEDAYEDGSAINDDMIDTAGTICEASKLLKSKGAKAVYVGATHAVFSGPAIERLKNAPIEECVVKSGNVVVLLQKSRCVGKGILMYNDLCVFVVMRALRVIVVGVGENQVGYLVGLDANTLKHLNRRAKIKKLKAGHSVAARIHEDLARIGFNKVDYQGDRQIFRAVSALKCHAFVNISLAVFYGDKSFDLAHTVTP